MCAVRMPPSSVDITLAANGKSDEEKSEVHVLSRI